MNMMYHIEKGETEIVPAGTPRYGNSVIHKDVLMKSKAAAQRVREEYEDTGPWSDFEWGMLNGKLSPLRWPCGRWASVDERYQP